MSAAALYTRTGRRLDAADHRSARAQREACAWQRQCGAPGNATWRAADGMHRVARFSGACARSLAGPGRLLSCRGRCAPLLGETAELLALLGLLLDLLLACWRPRAGVAWFSAHRGGVSSCTPAQMWASICRRAFVAGHTS